MVQLPFRRLGFSAGLSFTLGVAAAAVLVWTLDMQSRTRADHGMSGSPPNWISAPGRVEGASESIQLHTQLTGRVAAVLVQPGQHVRAGQELVRLDDQQYVHETQIAAAEVNAATGRLERLQNGPHLQERNEASALYEEKAAELRRAELAFERIRNLRIDDATTQEEFDDQQALLDVKAARANAAKARLEFLAALPRTDDVRIARAELEAARARLEVARDQLAHTRLVSPIAGQILRVNVQPGELAGPEASEAAIVLADTSSFRVRAFVEEFDAPRVGVGMPATITVDGLPGKRIAGQITRVSPSMSRRQLWTGEPSERYDSETREAWIALEPGVSFPVGLRVDVMIDASSSREPRARPPAAPRTRPAVADPAMAPEPAEAAARRAATRRGPQPAASK